MIRKVVRFSLFGALLSCGGDDKPAAGPDVPIEQMAIQMRQVICEKVHSCCNAEELKTNPGVGNDVPSCVAGINGESTYLLSDVVASVREGRLVYRPDKLAACIAEFKARSCAEAKMPPGDMDVTQLCAAAFQPQVPVGGACSDYWDCIGGSCAGDFGDLNDRCVPLQPIGGDCDEGPECQSGVCDEDDRVCQKRPVGAGNICFIGTEVVGQHGTASEGRPPVQP